MSLELSDRNSTGIKETIMGAKVDSFAEPSNLQWIKPLMHMLTAQLRSQGDEKVHKD